MSWYGWLTGVFTTGFITSLILASKLNAEAESMPSWTTWGGVFSPVYIFLILLLIFNSWPCWRRTPKGDIAAMSSRSSFLNVTLGFAGIVLAATFFIILPIELDKDPSHRSWGLTFLPLLLLVIGAYLYALISTLYYKYSANAPSRHPGLFSWLVCCQTIDSESSPNTEPQPICCGGLLNDHTLVTLYYAAWLLAGFLTILTLILMIPFLNAGHHHHTIAGTLVPFWIGLWLVILASAAIGIYEFTQKKTLDHTGLFLLHIGLGVVFFIFTIEILHTTGSNFHLLFVPLYLFFFFGALGYFIAFLNSRRSSDESTLMNDAAMEIKFDDFSYL